MSPASPTAPSAPLTLRADAIATAKAGVDLVIVGGGINGAGLARDATLRGLKVLLVEQKDWAAGTSSRSSKLVHGGLRYLENYEFGLVMEGTRERHRQYVLNPHLVTPLPFLMPVYKDGPHGLFKLNLGLWLYDLLSFMRTPKMHTKLSPKRTGEKAKGLRQEALTGSLLYYDCQTDDARLVLANALDARARKANVLARASYLGPVLNEQGQVRAARIEDRLSGEVFEVPCEHIAHATGPWTDRTSSLSGEPERLRPTKGVHIVVARERMPLDVAVVMSGVGDGRIVFAIPFENTTYIGTTDTDFDGDPDAVFASEQDLRYLLATANHFFPESALTTSDIRSAWAGLRPLIKSDAATAYQTSREHEIFVDPRGTSTIAGGKLTTYRAMVAEHLDLILRELKGRYKARGEKPPKWAKCQTHKLSLDPEARELIKHKEALSPFEQQLLHTHGSRSTLVKERMEHYPEERELVHPELTYTLAQVAVATLEEDAWGLEDVLVRRLQVHFRSADAGLAAARPTAELMAKLLGYDKAWIEREIASFQAFVDATLAARSRAD